MNTQPRDDVPAWHVATKVMEYDLNGTKRTVNVRYLERSDGATVERVGMNREFTETFLYKDNATEFQFIASRWDEERDKETDIYIVRLREPSVSEPMQRLACNHLADIESALLHYPLRKQPDTGPVREVIFDKSGIGEPPCYLRLREIT